MTFLRVELLFLIWVVPLLVLVFWYGRRKRLGLLGRYAGARSLATLAPVQTARRRMIRSGLILAAVLLLVFAAAGPQVGFQWQQIEREGVDLVIALDCSRSMLATDIAPSRLDRAKREIIDLLGMLQGDRVALTAFAGTAFLQCPLTLDYQAFDLFLNVLTADYLPVGGTDLVAALQTAMSAFDPGSAADKAVILITDGEHTGRGDPMAAAAEAKKTGIKLFCIGVGAEEGVPVPAAGGGFEKDRQGQIVLSRLDENLLSRMALGTGGAYVRSLAGDMDLDAIYRERIRSELSTATVESGRKQVWADRFQWPLALAVILLGLALLLPLAPRHMVLLMTAGMLLGPIAPARAGALQQGYQAYENGDYEQARQNFIKGQLDDPDNPRLLYNLGNTYYQQGDYAAAQDHYRQALARVPEEKQTAHQAVNDIKARLHYNLGNAAYRRGELPAAVKEYESALAFMPDDVQAAENLAFVRRQLEQQQQQDQSQQQSGQDQKPSAHQPAGGKDQQPGEQPEKSSASEAGDRSGLDDQPSSGSQEKQADPPDGDPAAGQDQADSSDQRTQDLTAAGQPPQNQDQQQGREAPGARLLNRLKDQPGRAMMPHYQKRQVEKDW